MKKLGELETKDGQKLTISVMEPTTAPQGQLSEIDFNALIIRQDARAGWDGAPFRHFTPSEVEGREQRQYKSYEFIVPHELADDACYWCEFFHGGGSVVAKKPLPGGLVAVYSEYRCW